jgi:hypothetical protein
MGKNFSCNNLGQRKKSDFYETPYSLTSQFIEAENIPRTWKVLEPACGDGAIVRVLEKYHYTVIGKSIEHGDDFLDETCCYDAIITNPPFSLAFEFINKAKKLSNYVAMLLPLSYLHGKRRYDAIYSDTSFPLSKVYVFTRYPMLGDPLRSDGKYRTGMMVYAWFVWIKGANTPPIIAWLDNNQHVLNKK